MAEKNLNNPQDRWAHHLELMQEMTAYQSQLRLVDIASDYEEMLDEIKRLHYDSAQDSKRIADITSIKDQHFSHIRQLQCDLQVTRSTIERLTQERTGLRNTVARMSSDRRAAAEAFDELSASAESRKADNSALRAQVAAYEELMRDNGISEHEQLRARMRARIDDAVATPGSCPRCKRQLVDGDRKYHLISAYEQVVQPGGGTMSLAHPACTREDCYGSAVMCGPVGGET